MSCYKTHESFDRKKRKQTTNPIYFWFIIPANYENFTFPSQPPTCHMLLFWKRVQAGHSYKALSCRPEGSRGGHGRMCSRLYVPHGRGLTQFTPLTRLMALVINNSLRNPCPAEQHNLQSQNGCRKGAPNLSTCFKALITSMFQRTGYLHVPKG